MIEEITRCTIDEEIKLFAIPQGIEEGYEVLVEINLLDKDRNILKTILPKGVKVEKNIDKEKYGDSENIILCKFVIKELAKDIKVEEVKYVTGWIDSNDDKELSIEYDEVSVLEVSHELITKDMLIAMGCTNIEKEKELLEALNKYCEQYEINTPIRIAHFLSQTAHESDGFKTFEEGKSYSHIGARAKLIKYNNYFKELIQKYGSEAKAMNYNRFFPNGQIKSKQPDLFNFAYAGGENGDEKSGDGFKYRGRGIIQITKKGAYKNFTNRHNKKNPDDYQNFVENPDLVASEKYAVESACDYWSNKIFNGKNLNLWADEGFSDEVVLRISAIVNGYFSKSVLEYNEFSNTEKSLYTKANNNLYIKTPNGYDEPNKTFGRLQLFHKLKEYMGLQGENR